MFKPKENLEMYDVVHVVNSNILAVVGQVDDNRNQDHATPIPMFFVKKYKDQESKEALTNYLLSLSKKYSNDRENHHEFNNTYHFIRRECVLLYKWRELRNERG